MLDDKSPHRRCANLRNPIHQAFSYYKYLKRYNQIDSESPREAFEKYPAIIAQAKYYNFLLPYRNRFTRRNVYIMLFEKLHTEPVVELSRLYQFLEVDSSFVPYAAKKVVSKGINARIKQLEKVRASLFFFLKQHNTTATHSSLIKMLRLLSFFYVTFERYNYGRYGILLVPRHMPDQLNDKEA